MNAEDRSSTAVREEAAPSRDPTREEAGAEGDLPLPVGTLFLMMLYIMVLAGMWGAIYFEFIGR